MVPVEQPVLPRALAWLSIVDPQATMEGWNLPGTLQMQLKDRLEQHSSFWVGWDATERDVAQLEDRTTLVFLRPRAVRLDWLKALGFTTSTFVAVPRIEAVRWVIPTGTSAVAAAAWDMYMPQRRRGHLAKAGMWCACRLGLAAWLGDAIIIAQRQSGALEHALREQVAHPLWYAAISVGAAGQRRKETIRIARPDGRPLVYCKVATSASGAGLVRNETTWLRIVPGLPVASIAVPTVLYDTPFGSGHMLVMSPLPTTARPSGSSLTPLHMRVLGEFAQVHGSLRVGDLLQRLGDAAERLRDHAESDWIDRTQRALDLVRQFDELVERPATLAHGDFVPYNLRVSAQGTTLFVLDWEQASQDQFPLWDGFHFCVQVARLVRRVNASTAVGMTLDMLDSKLILRALGLDRAMLRALLVAYLLGSGWSSIALQRSGDRDGVAAMHEYLGAMLDTILNHDQPWSDPTASRRVARYTDEWMGSR